MIKSKKAKEYLSNLKKVRIYGVGEIDGVVGTSDAYKAVEIAESELYSEEQCIEAFCGTCELRKTLDCPVVLDCDCEYLDRFLSALKSKQ